MVANGTGSERARNAKTAGATLAEAGKINESLMYLGQCLQMQSDAADSSKVSFSTIHSVSR
jgi:Kinesin motor domain